MASGNYARNFAGNKFGTAEPVQRAIPPRATRQLPALKEQGKELGRQTTKILPETTKILAIVRPPWRFPRVVNEFEEHPLARHASWLRPFVICMVVAVVTLTVLISAGTFQRPVASQLMMGIGGQSFPIQVGGTLGEVKVWTNSKGPLTPKKPIPAHTGPYAVTGPNSLSVDFMNSVLAYYHSPAAGKAQALYNDGVKYGLDSAYALAFFMHESSFGTTGVARVTLSLSNMRCVPEYKCFNENGGYSMFDTWEQGFEAWFKLIRNLYIAQWGLVTVDQIIPVYAPNSDGNNEAAYIANLKHTIDTWRSGTIQV